MKKSIQLANFGLLLAAGFFSANVSAIDFVEAAQTQTQVLVDNGKVRVIRATFEAGDEIPMHSHPDIVVYVVKGGKVKFTNEDGKVTESDTQAGEAFFRPAVTHSHVHIDGGEAIVIELKN